MTENASYNGVTNTNLLTATGNTLIVNQEESINVSLTISNYAAGKVYWNSATISGTSPQGTTVTDISDDFNVNNTTEFRLKW